MCSAQVENEMFGIYIFQCISFIKTILKIQFNSKFIIYIKYFKDIFVFKQHSLNHLCLLSNTR